MMKNSAEMSKNIPNNQILVNNITIISQNNTKNNNEKKTKTTNKSIIDIEYKIQDKIKQS